MPIHLRPRTTRHPARHRGCRRPALPNFIAEGFNRDDYARDFEALPAGTPFPAGQKFLYGDRPPAVDHYVKVQFSFTEPLLSEIDGPTTWCLCGGRVVEVLSPRRVRAIVQPTSLNTPAEAEHDWDIVLEYVPGLPFPWVVQSMVIAASDPPRCRTLACRR